MYYYITVQPQPFFKTTTSIFMCVLACVSCSGSDRITELLSQNTLQMPIHLSIQNQHI